MDVRLRRPSRLGRDLGSWRSRPARQGPRGDHGFSLIELIVAMLILALIIPATLLVARNLNQQTANIGDSVLGVQQDQTAGEALYPYLRAATTVLQGSSSTLLKAEIDYGFDKANAVPNLAELDVQVVPPAGTNLDATVVTSLTPANGIEHSVGTYFAKWIPSQPPFTYLWNNGPGVTGTLAPTGTLPSGPSASVQLTQIIAVTVSITFLAGPNRPLADYNSVQSSHFVTTVYLENSSGSQAPRTHVTVLTPDTIIDQSQTPDYVEAAIQPPPDVGTVSFELTFANGSSGPQFPCAAAPVLDGVASCPFVAQGYGQGTITAEYSPPTDNPSYLGSTGTASIISYLTTYTGVVSALVPDNAPAQITVEVWDQLGPSFPPPPLNGSQENNEPVESYVDISYYECPSTTTSSSTSTSTSTSTNLADTCSSTPIFSPPDEVPLTSTGSDGRPQAVDTNWTYNPTQIPPGTTIEVVASYVGAAYWYQSPNVIATFTVPT